MPGIKRNGSVWQNLDWLTVGLYSGILLFGWLIVYAVQYAPDGHALIGFDGLHGRQFMWIVISLVIGFTILIVEAEFFTSFAWVIYVVVFLLLIAVLLFAREVNGARSWLEIGSIKIQPSEFAKYATALALAKYLSMPQVNMSVLKDRLIALGVIGLPMGMIVIQGDVGSALVFTSFLLALYREGFSISLVIAGVYIATLFILTLILGDDILQIALAVITFLATTIVAQRYLRKQQQEAGRLIGILFLGIATFVLVMLLVKSFLVSLVLSIGLPVAIWFAGSFAKSDRVLITGTAAAYVLSALFSFFLVNYLFSDVLEPHQQERIKTLIGQSDDRDANYNVNQSKMTIASGGLAGKGFLQGTFTRYGHVPEQQTDFIFCTIGEEFGFLGSAGFLLAYLVLLIRIVVIAERQRSAFSRCFAYGVAGLFFVQITINVGMTIGLVPVIGIPLPFVSYGGSSVLAFSLLIFTMLRLDADRLMVFR